jgi:dipeptidyl aminopeptidase/acylaminoacyl peptidase
MFRRSIRVASFVLFAAAGWTPLPAAARPLALDDYYRIITVQAPAMSPDGRRVAFIRTAIVESENRRQSELWIAAADGSTPPRRVSDPVLTASAPRWSADGKLLAFSGRRRGAAAADDGGEAIWFVNTDRLDEPPVHVRGVGGSPIFSPDNQWIAFTRRVTAAKTASFTSEAERTVNERFKGKAYDWLNYRFDQRGYLPDPRDPHCPAGRRRAEATDARRRERRRRDVAWRQRRARVRGE